MTIDDRTPAAPTEATSDTDERRASFSAMTAGTAEDWGIIAHQSLVHSSGLADRVLDHPRVLGGDFGGFAGHEHYDHMVTFCHDYDQPAFDPSYDTLPLDHFEPAVRLLMSHPRRTIYRPVDAAP